MSKPAVKQRANETSVAFAAFGAYLEQGPRRTMRRTVEILGRKPSYLNQLARWSKQHEWQARTKHYDEALLNRRLESRELNREQARQMLVDALPLAMQTIINLADDEDAPKSTRLAASKEIAALCGVIAPKRVELSGPDGGAIRTAFRKSVEGLTDEQLAAFEEMLVEDEEEVEQ